MSHPIKIEVPDTPFTQSPRSKAKSKSKMSKVQFEIGQSVLYQQHYSGAPPSNKIYSAVVIDVFNYGVNGSYYIKFDGDIAPEWCGYEGLLQTIAEQKELKPHTRSADFAEKNAAWLLEVETVNKAIAEERAREEAAYIAEMTEKYAHVVPGLLVKWKVVDCQYGGYNSNSYEGTVTERNSIDYCYVMCTDGKIHSVKVKDLL